MTPTRGAFQPNFRIRDASGLRGYMHGIRQNLVRLEALVDLDSPDHSMMRTVADAVLPRLPKDDAFAIESLNLNPIGGIANLQIFALISIILQNAVGGAVNDHAVVIPQDGLQDGKIRVTVDIPTFSVQLGLRTVHWLAQFTRRTVEARQSNDDRDIPAQLEAGLSLIEDFAPRGFNTRIFLNHAHAREIPTVQLPARIIQYGYGKGARRFQSSRSDETSALGEFLTKNKVAGNKLLKMANIPVAEQAHVTDLATAKKSAQDIGYPVVLKPYDLDNGVGVFPGIKDEQDLVYCFELAQKQSDRLVIEKHIPGETYRIVVVKGEVLPAWIRVYPTVTGDGTKSISELLDDMNAHDDRSSTRFSLLKPISINTELEHFLQLSGRSFQTIPQKGEEVRVGRTSNWSQGGDVVPAEEDIHPDNVDLCRKAADLVDLDIAGIDLIVDGLGTSWKNTSSAICEVNAMPQLDDNILEFYCIQRAPVVLHLGAGLLGDGFADMVAQALDRTREVIVGSMNATDVIQHGFPLAHVDVVVLSDSLTDQRILSEALEMAVKQGASQVLAVKTHPLASRISDVASGINVTLLPDIDSLNDRLARLEPVLYPAPQPH